MVNSWVSCWLTVSCLLCGPNPRSWVSEPLQSCSHRPGWLPSQGRLGARVPTHLFLSRGGALPRLPVWRLLTRGLQAMAAIPGAWGTSLLGTRSPGVAATPAGRAPAQGGLRGTDLPSAAPWRAFPLLVNRGQWRSGLAGAGCRALKPRRVAPALRGQPVGLWPAWGPGGGTGGRVQASPPLSGLTLAACMLRGSGWEAGRRKLNTDLPVLKIHISSPEN